MIEGLRLFGKTRPLQCVQLSLALVTELPRYEIQKEEKKI